MPAGAGSTRNESRRLRLVRSRRRGEKTVLRGAAQKPVFRGEDRAPQYGRKRRGK